MATGWVKSLQCKSRAFEDVYVPSPKHLNHLLPSTSCRKSFQNLKDVVETNTKKKPRKSNPPSSSSKSSKPIPRFHSKPTKSDDPSSTPLLNRVRPISTSSSSVRKSTTHDPYFPTLTELPEGHPSRNVVEIIFHTSWSPKSFSGRIDMIFKVQNLPKTVARFEEYREIVKSRAVSGSPGSSSRKSKEEDDDARCIADGNEVMRFHCLGPTTAGAIYDAGGMCTFSGKESAICTFSGSGGAHENGGGGGGNKGRRAMLVCRVIAGRVCKRIGRLESFLESRVGFDSVNEGENNNGKLLVFDSRAVLPCFLIIYKTIDHK